MSTKNTSELGNSITKTGKSMVLGGIGLIFIGAFLIFALLIIIGIFAGGSSDNKGDESVAIPEYIIENEEKLGSIKASFDVRIQEELNEDKIKLIAEDIYSKNNNYERVFISYQLPGMKIGWAYATSHYDPEFNIKIFGPTPEEKKVMLENANSITGEIIGKWYDPSINSQILVIFEDSEGLKLKRMFKDDSRESMFPEQILMKEGEKYMYENDNGEYLQINTENELEWYTENGLYLTLSFIE
jgi:hypothetical protein